METPKQEIPVDPELSPQEIAEDVAWPRWTRPVLDPAAFSSGYINELATALSVAQGEITGAEKGALNPHFQRRYADLASVWEAIRQPLSKNGLAIVQLPSADGPRVTVVTILCHKSGQYITSTLTMLARENSPQGIGSAITYARRYSLMAIVGVAPEDDDGEAAQGRDKKREVRYPDQKYEREAPRQEEQYTVGRKESRFHREPEIQRREPEILAAVPASEPQAASPATAPSPIASIPVKSDRERLKDMIIETKLVVNNDRRVAGGLVNKFVIGFLGIDQLPPAQQRLPQDPNDWVMPLKALETKLRQSENISEIIGQPELSGRNACLKMIEEGTLYLETNGR